MATIKTQNLGYPRIGKYRELKKAVEAYWRGDASLDDLKATGAALRRKHWNDQAAAGIDFIPCNDFSYYDQVLDMSLLLGNVPHRFDWDGRPVDYELMFRIARGRADNDARECCSRAPEYACEMTKWFDTNYHYIVPEFSENSQFRVSSSKVFDEFAEASALGIAATPVLIGPLTYLTIGKAIDASPGFDRFTLGEALIPAYVEILRRLSADGASRVQLDEPALCLDLSGRQRAFVEQAFAAFRKEVPELPLHVASYFGELRENLSTFLNLPVAGLHIDGVRGASELNAVYDGLRGSEKMLSLGIVDGRNIWKTDLRNALRLLEQAIEQIGPDRLIIAPSCSLLHVPVTLTQENKLDPNVREWLAFAEEKLGEISTLRDALEGANEATDKVVANEASIQSRKRSQAVRRPAVQARLAALRDRMFQRPMAFPERRALQRERLPLPLFPTTTIGSFPQTNLVRRARSRFRQGEWSEEQYETFLRLTTSDCIERQEKAGLDVLVHGEFERTDMVEYFGEQLEGFAFTQFGWVQSYGSRCVKPPIVFGDVHRPAPMTVEWARFAQSQTSKPMKGMLTGPVTILQWSFVRDDQPRQDTALQIALAIRDEAQDLERAGLPIIQIDEAAIREGMPLRQAERSAYLDWAVKAFRLASCGVANHTQIHTHMC
ncbi:MAG: 5-methyltetrahydropteroyltriglutamate--homocysteine S-methyltransferase, partial [Verrucomicrobiae bacterium]|nr:5-methyltetrahydropteroyltriglutamate--homocysteine S-methyltransferase [Verrucomicrobiae bacterium]